MRDLQRPAGLAVLSVLPFRFSLWKCRPPATDRGGFRVVSVTERSRPMVAALMPSKPASAPLGK